MQAKQRLQILIWRVKTVEKISKGEFATGHRRFTDVAAAAFCYFNAKVEG